jgi:16S rRNA (uracil1498-N3)-methyltransferase
VRKFFVDRGVFESGDGVIHIEDAMDVRHIRNVLRMKRGDSVVVCDGTGREYTGVIVDIGDRVALSVADIVQSAEPRTEITLYQCVPKQSRMEVVIQKSTELGVVRFVPVLSERSVPRPRDDGRRMERWRRIAREAAKQSGRSVVPSVDSPVTLSDAVGTFGGYDLVLFPYENEDGVTIKDVLRGCLSRMGGDGLLQVAVVIGPEGGFAAAEAAAIVGAGGEACSLGGTILRTETAGPAAISMVLYELEL